MSDELRRIIWPKLLGINFKIHTKIYKKSKYSEQIEKDIDRSMWKFTKNATELERQFKRIQLSRIVNTVISSDNNLHYYQGFHDICEVFLLVCGEYESIPCIQRLCKYYLK